MVHRSLHVVPRETSSLTTELDEATLRACKNGETQAQRAFVVCYQRAVFALLSRLLGHGSDIEDLAQETFIRALRALPDFEPNDSLPPSHWLLTIAARLATDHHRKRRTAERARSVLKMVPEQHSRTPESDLDRQRLRDALVRAIEQLSFDQRAVIVMTEFHAMSIAEVARCLDVNENTVKTRLFRARAHLSTALSAHRQCP
jgi:RNA polymerase sigma-70 factor (ECF subfamily)